MTDREIFLLNVKLPVRYDSSGQYFWDADNNMIADLRGWGRLQKLPNGEEVQDAIGRFIAEAINEYGVMSEPAKFEQAKILHQHVYSLDKKNFINIDEEKTIEVLNKAGFFIVKIGTK